jgi:hypothetical protein
MTHVVFNTRTRCIVLEGTQAQCLSAADTWNKASPRTFVVRPR